MVDIDFSIAAVPLTRGLSTVLDASELWRIEEKWHAVRCSGLYYAARSESVGGKKKLRYLHREILNVPLGTIVDHINRNTLDNRKSNLRVSSFSMNSLNQKKRCSNTSGFKGVDWLKRKGKWRARFLIHGRSYHLGSFDSAEEAGFAYDLAARKYAPGVASLNFPQGSEVGA